jgi:hypothetical protein
MEWTKETPTVGGTYWNAAEASHSCSCSCKTSEPKVAKVKADENGNLVVLFAGVADRAPIETVNGSWWGPLTPPAQ